jgi:hypothetical protein
MKMFNSEYIAKIGLSNSKTYETMNLWANLMDTNISKKWIGVIYENNSRGYELKSNYRRYKNLKEQELEFQEFKKNISYINENYDRPLTQLTTLEELLEDDSVLNDLHEEFEIYGDRLAEIIDSGYFDDPKSSPKYAHPWPGDAHNKVLHESFLLLNEQIHNTETVVRRRLNPELEASCTCLTDFKPRTNAGYIHVPLEPEDYMLFNPTIDWGWLYLGYNTLGKNWMSTSLDDDVAAVERDEIRPQQRFAAELFMNFVPAYPNTTQYRLHKWWTQNNFTKFKDPRMKLNELCLGYLPLGQLCLYQEGDGEMFSMNDLWFASKQDKIDWNKNVWSKYDTVDFLVIEKK